MLPQINISETNNIHKGAFNGNLAYAYAPFQNLLTNTVLSDLNIPLSNANIDVSQPLEISTEEAYDGSINLIVNDHTNPLKMVNSRFYLDSSTTYKIADRKGNLDTNIYTSDNFKVEAGMIKIVRTIPHVIFNGIDSGGQLKIGNYNFYFKLADYDGNESEFIAESGQVVCYVGNVNQPDSIRGGQIDEDSGKIVKFTIENLDLAYNYINVYFTRSTGNNNESKVEAYKILNKFKITSVNSDVTITGFETSEKIDISDINIQYINIDACQSQTNCQNMTFVANTQKDYSLYDTLENYSLFITPEIAYDNDIGNLAYNYSERYPNTGYEYYNASNIYYKLGYWTDIYRFGIVYIMNDYSLSPVFNIRGCTDLTYNFDWEIATDNVVDSTVNVDNNYIISGTSHNAKGVVRISEEASASKHVFNSTSPITPIGIKFTFHGNVIEGSTLNEGLKDITKGFFIVRQKRIPTILAQGIGIATSTKSYFPTFYAKYNGNTGYVAESLLYNGVPYGSTQQDSTGALKKYPMLGRSIFALDSISGNVVNNALLCPEAAIRKDEYNSFFNSTDYLLRRVYVSDGVFEDKVGDNKQFVITDLNYNKTDESINTELTLIESGVQLIQNSTYKFSSCIGDRQDASIHVDPIYGDYNDPEDSTTDDNFNNSVTKVRGLFGSYLGTSATVSPGRYYNIYKSDYDESNMQEYFKIRYLDSSPYTPIGDRYEWDDLTVTVYNSLTYTKTEAQYRGDCYINTVTMRMHHNFIDPVLPTNKTMRDQLTWYKNIRIKTKATTVGTTSTTGVPVDLYYRNMLQLFTYKHNEASKLYSGDNDDTSGTYEIPYGSILTPDNKHYQRYVDLNGEFGAEKIERASMNVVPQGLWVTVRICSSFNLDMRDWDVSHPEEEAEQKKKRGFYPLQALDLQNNQEDSMEINHGISRTQGWKEYFEVPDVPFIKNSFNTRVYYSNVLQKSAFTNGNRIYEATHFKDYTMEYGAITKIIEWYGTLVVICEHGIFKIPVNERALVSNQNGQNVYINTANVLPENPTVISNTYGSVFTDSITYNNNYIYGIDTIGKKIWRTNGQKFDLISDMKIQKFLNDNIELSENEKTSTRTCFVKSHFNAFKRDILFTYYYNSKMWNICYNEILDKWITQYTWLPEFTENIDNIFYSFASVYHTNSTNFIYKHGFAGNVEESGNIQPTTWYDTQYPFEFEFVVNADQGIEKVFDNVAFISNAIAPQKIFYEIYGDDYTWSKYKSQLYGFTTNTQFQNLLNTGITKLPYIKYYTFDVNDSLSFYNLSDNYGITIRKDMKTNDKLIDIFNKIYDIKDVGYIKGNARYLEDKWVIQIPAVHWKNIYQSGTQLMLTSSEEARVRDKHVRIRVCYDGSDYAILTGIKTFYKISFS